jgi:hypothetical protein
MSCSFLFRASATGWRLAGGWGPFIIMLGFPVPSFFLFPFWLVGGAFEKAPLDNFLTKFVYFIQDLNSDQALIYNIHMNKITSIYI